MESERKQYLVVNKEQTKPFFSSINPDNCDDFSKEPMLFRQEENIDNRDKPDLTWKQVFYGVAVVIVWEVLFYIAVISSQVTSLKSNIFCLNSIRFLLQFVIIVPIVIWKQCSLTIQKKHIYLIIAGSLSNLTFASCFYSVATYMPLGNLDALSMTFYCIISVFVDLCRRSVTWRAVVAVLVATLGILMIAQPWQEREKYSSLPLSPCNYLNNASIVQVKSNSSSIDNADQSPISVSKEVLGYFLIMLAAAGLTALGNFIKCLIDEYPIPTVMFWLAMVETLTSFMIGTIWTQSQHESYLMFPEGTYCLMFTLLFIICSAFSQSISYLGYSYFTVSTLGLCHISVSLALYASQRTFLKTFHPGHANKVEIVGILIVILGTVILPAIFMIVKQHGGQK